MEDQLFKQLHVSSAPCGLVLFHCPLDIGAIARRCDHRLLRNSCSPGRYQVDNKLSLHKDMPRHATFSDSSQEPAVVNDHFPIGSNLQMNYVSSRCLDTYMKNTHIYIYIYIYIYFFLESLMSFIKLGLGLWSATH